MIESRCFPVLLVGLLMAITPWGSSPMVAQEVLASHTLRVGIILSATDMKVPDVEAADAADMIAGLIGLETRYPIYTGRPVTVADLGPPTLVRRNATVTMVFINGGLGIRTEGRALDSGGAGEIIRVLNLASRQPVLALVTGANQVEVRR